MFAFFFRLLIHSSDLCSVSMSVLVTSVGTRTADPNVLVAASLEEMTASAGSRDQKTEQLRNVSYLPYLGGFKFHASQPILNQCLKMFRRKTFMNFRADDLDYYRYCPGKSFLGNIRS